MPAVQQAEFERVDFALEGAHAELVPILLFGGAGQARLARGLRHRSLLLAPGTLQQHRLADCALGRSLLELAILPGVSLLELQILDPAQGSGGRLCLVPNRTHAGRVELVEGCLAFRLLDACPGGERGRRLGLVGPLGELHPGRKLISGRRHRCGLVIELQLGCTPILDQAVFTQDPADLVFQSDSRTELLVGDAVLSRRHADIGHQRRAERTVGAHLKICHQTGQRTVHRVAGQGRTLQKIGRRIAGQHQKRVVAKRPGLFVGDQPGEACIDSCCQFLGDQPMLVERFPFELAPGLVNQHRGRQRQRDEKREQQKAQATLVKPTECGIQHVIHPTSAGSRHRE